MNTAAWIVQVILAVVFLVVGILKLMRTKEQVLEQMGDHMGWVNDFSQTQIRGIGVLEILGALGMILPGLTKIATILTPLAGVGLALVMVGAGITHIRRKEYPMLVVNIVLFVLALFVAYARFSAAPL
ncbi:MAG: DoxX family protein [Caldilineae bacterium]|nr:MAG: DoxX family protein [Caldilineae bacterium]